MNRLPKIFICFLIIIVCVGCDQVTKAVAINTLTYAQPVPMLGNLFVLQLVKNDGAFLSLGSDWPYFYRLIFLILLPIIVIFSIGVVILKSNRFSSFSLISFALILGGGIGNLWDRLLNDGLVVDFMNLGIGNLRTGIFNFADVFIMFGLGMLLYENLRKYHIKKYNIPGR